MAVLVQLVEWLQLACGGVWCFRSMRLLCDVVQVTNPVQWETSLKTMLDKGLEQSYEIGPNKVIAGIMKRIDRGHSVENITA